jgi:CRISPR system Cascade subunit CasD
VTATLLLRLYGPLQSWGMESRFSHRDTGREPSKSGVIGLLCAALGKPRAESPADGHPSLAELAALRMGVRVDQPGSLLTDFHTASNVLRAQGGIKPTVLSYRNYLCDACFLVGLEGDRSLLARLEQAVRRPVWHLSLGRKSCVPALPLTLPEAEPNGPGLVDLPLEQALQSVTLIRREPGNSPVHLVIENLEGGTEIRKDVPVCFAERDFASRLVGSKDIPSEELKPCISPDSY